VTKRNVSALDLTRGRFSSINDLNESESYQQNIRESVMFVHTPRARVRIFWATQPAL
jgi:hypothetical protein